MGVRTACMIPLESLDETAVEAFLQKLIQFNWMFRGKLFFNARRLGSFRTHYHPIFPYRVSGVSYTRPHAVIVIYEREGLERRFRSRVERSGRVYQSDDFEQFVVNLAQSPFDLIKYSELMQLLGSDEPSAEQAYIVSQTRLYFTDSMNQEFVQLNMSFLRALFNRVSDIESQKPASERMRLLVDNKMVEVRGLFGADEYPWVDRQIIGQLVGGQKGHPQALFKLFLIAARLMLTDMRARDESSFVALADFGGKINLVFDWLFKIAGAQGADLSYLPLPESHQLVPCAGGQCAPARMAMDQLMQLARALPQPLAQNPPAFARRLIADLKARLPVEHAL